MACVKNPSRSSPFNYQHQYWNVANANEQLACNMCISPIKALIHNFYAVPARRRIAALLIWSEEAFSLPFWDSFDFPAHDECFSSQKKAYKEGGKYRGLFGALGEDSPRCETVLSFAVSEQQECLLSGRPQTCTVVWNYR